MIRWTHQAKGHFCILDSQKLANMWGKEKCKENMTKEKFHRSLQYQIRIGKLRKIGKNCYSIMVDGNRSKRSKAQKIYENNVSEVFVYENLVKTSDACPNSFNKTEAKCNRTSEQETTARQFTLQALEPFNSGTFERTYEKNRKCIKNIVSQLVSLRECNQKNGFHINWVNEEVSPNADQVPNPCFTEEGKFSETISSLTLSSGSFLDLFSNSFLQVKDLDNQENQDKVLENWLLSSNNFQFPNNTISGSSELSRYNEIINEKNGLALTSNEAFARITSEIPKEHYSGEPDATINIDFETYMTTSSKIGSNF